MKKFLLLIALIISGVGFVNAQYVEDNTIIDYDGYSLQFTVTSVEPAECELTSYDGSPTDIIIPATVTFGETELEVTSIGTYAFHGCSSLTSVSFGDNSQLASIGWEAFRECSGLTSIEIPSGVTSIRDAAFNGCSSLTSVSFGDNSQLASIGWGAFNGCSSLTGIEIPSGVTSIGDHAFSGCSSLTSIEIPSGVTEIGNYVFAFLDEWSNPNGESNLESVTFGEDSQLTSIGNHAFSGCSSLTSIEIPSGVTSIGNSAFSSCSSLTNISFGENSQLTSIGSDAFMDCSSLTSIEIPSGVTSIGGYAFGGCSSLTSIEIPSGVTSIGTHAFYGCSSLTNISFGEDSQLTYIGSSAFNGCSSLTDIEIPSGVTSIGDAAFSGCSSLTSIEIPSGVTSIGTDAFHSCSRLTSVSFGEDSQLTSIGSYAFNGCSSLTGIEIPSGVTSIGEYAFMDCSSLTNISFGEDSQLTSIGSSAFNGCSSLTGIEIPSGVTSIGSYAFYSCSRLTSVSFGENSQLTSIGDAAFHSCSRLTGIDIPSGVTEIPGLIFENCTRLKYIRLLAETVVSVGDNYLGYIINTSCQIQVPEELIESYKNTKPWFYYRITKIYPYFIGEELVVDYDGYSLKYTAMEDYRCSVTCYAQPSEPTSITIPTTVTFGETELEVTSIGVYAFNGCSSLTSIEIPSGVTSIGYDAFGDCSSLTSIEIPSGVTSIGTYAFYGCSSLTNISFGEDSQLTSIGEAAFEGCSSLTNISFGEDSQLTSIGGYAFYGCSSLTSIEIPSGVTEIGNYVFAFVDEWGNSNGESNLESVTFGEDSQLTSIGNCAFAGCHLLTSIEIPSGVTSIGDAAFSSCSSLTNISFGENSQLTSIGSDAFNGCSSLTGIEIPSGVTSIGSSAFYECSRLTSVSFGENSQLTSIGGSAFNGCSSLTSIEIPSGVTSIGDAAFYGCSSLTNISFGEDSQLTSIGSSAFYECSSLTSVSFGENSQLTSIGGNAFSYCYNLTSIEIPSGVTSIGDCAFESSSLTSVSFGENSQLASIGNSAFYDCNLKNIDIPNSVTSIGNHAFGGCSKLKSIEIPENVEEIGLGIIIYCDDIEMITVDEDNVVFDSRNDCNAIIKTSENKLVCGCVNTIIPSSVTTIGNRAFMGSNITDIVVPNNVTSIEDNAFAVCFGLVSIAFEDGSQLSSIGNYAFDGCSSLTSVTFGENSQLASIGEGTFTGCSILTSIEIPSNVTSIAGYAFQNCFSLISLTFGDNSKLSYIGDGAFAECYITSIEIPSGVTMIGNDPFGFCRYIISYMETPIFFEFYSWVETIFVPESSVEDYENTYPWNNYTILPIDPASVNVTVNDEEAGSVVGAGDYCKSMEIRLMATPNRGYDFVGWKEDGEIVSTDSDYYFTLYGDRNLEAVFELSKYWHPDLHLYPNTMNMITEVKVDGELQNSTLLEVGAFCGDELRGSGRIQYNAAADKYIAYISVMGETDDQIKFRLFDHETYQELSHASLSVLPFETNAIVGTVTEPYLTEFSSTARVTVTINPSDAGYVEGAGDYPIGSLVSLKATNYLPYLFESWTINGEVVGTTKTYNFVATESVNIKANFTCSQRTELSSGWNWTSFHTFIYGYNGLLALELSLGDYGLHIKNQNSFVTNHNGAWYGSLTSVDVEQMYIIRVSEDFTLVLNGLVVNPENYHISLTKNWKWIGYPVSVEMSVAEALSGITPSEGDVIKTQGEFAMYNEGIGWSGNLTKMKPGKGYMYYNNSNSNKTLTYPTPSSGQSRSVETEDEITHWTADDTKYPSNMNMVAVLNVDGNELEANYEIAAFAGEELRGNARPIYIESLDRYMLFLTISGEETENLKFKYYNEETDEEFDITENIMFSMNAVVGSVDEPYVFNCNINDEANNTADIEMYPNPVNAGEEINLGMTYDKVEIYNAIGAKIAEYNNVNKLAQIEIAGIYVIKATIGGEVKYDRLIVQ